MCIRDRGTLIGQQFYAERNQLLHQLKALVNKPLVKSLARHSVQFRPYEDMRRALNRSSRSIVHEWSTAGVTGIPGYSTYVGNAAKAARFLKYGAVSYTHLDVYKRQAINELLLN